MNRFKLSRLEALIEAQRYANLMKSPVHVYRRGDDYRVSKNDRAGWKLVDIVQPNLPVPTQTELELEQALHLIKQHISAVNTQQSQDLHKAVQLIESVARRYALGLRG